MKTHHLHLHAEPYNAIASGQKTIESRLDDQKRQSYQIGDKLVFENRDNPAQTIHAQITHLHRYTTFAELFAGARLTGFSSTDPVTLLAGIRHYYSTEDEVLYGVVGIEFMVLIK